jgi:hypothetical protein
MSGDAHAESVRLRCDGLHEVRIHRVVDLDLPITVVRVPADFRQCVLDVIDDEAGARRERAPSLEKARALDTRPDHVATIDFPGQVKEHIVVVARIKDARHTSRDVQQSQPRARHVSVRVVQPRQ